MRRGKVEYDILIVDDELSVAQGIARMLAPSRTFVARSIDQAMAALEEHVPAAVVCDYFLRGEVALPLLKYIKENHPGVRRVLYSGYRDPAIRNTVDRGYADTVLAKPATSEQLRAAVKPVDP